MDRYLSGQQKTLGQEIERLAGYCAYVRWASIGIPPCWPSGLRIVRSLGREAVLQTL
jgi:hypothetical protein